MLKMNHFKRGILHIPSLFVSEGITIRTHLFLFLSQAVPHGGHDLRHLPERSIGVLAFNRCLGVSEEECVR